ncbi:hypothetical protein AWC38_SpisGene18075 [Stylophora pistillata]|uniref:Uncharacterized protein n=1 Tax=Stylophora pistillata TaxID=50429 RepID=A0A2B4RLA9_STYPI|nr:hypothetical protein AWC38_SpisGene18075 [Stylophora pistillata]
MKISLFLALDGKQWACLKTSRTSCNPSISASPTNPSPHYVSYQPTLKTRTSRGTDRERFIRSVAPTAKPPTSVVETSVTTTDNSPSQDYTHPDDHTTLSHVTPGFKPFARIHSVSGIQSSCMKPNVHQRAKMAYVMRRNLAVFRAGTADGPSFTSSWTEDTNTEDVKSGEQLKKNVTWNITKLEKCKGGMSLMDFGTLVRAVLVYMKNHYPTTPDEFNFQAELKAASHWYWHPGSEQSLYNKDGHLSSETKHPEPVLGPHKDLRVKIAALDTCKKWVRDVQELKESSLHFHNLSIEEDEEYSTDEDRKNELFDDLEESVFELKTYFSFTGNGAIRV